MNSSISGHHVEVTPAMHQYATGRIMSLKRRCEALVSTDVTFTTEWCAKEGKNYHKVCAKVILAGKEVHVSHVDEDAYAAVDKLREKVARRISQYNGKRHSHRRHGCPKRELAKVLSLH
jgi:putative sigma-54 modulation protein